jgi:hypothetical protein
MLAWEHTILPYAASAHALVRIDHVKSLLMPWHINPHNYIVVVLVLRISILWRNDLEIAAVLLTLLNLKH